MAVGYIRYAAEQEAEQKVWETWNQMHPLMIAGLIPYKSYDEIKKEMFKAKKTYAYNNLTKEEIEKDILPVVAAYEGR